MKETKLEKQPEMTERVTENNPDLSTRNCSLNFENERLTNVLLEAIRYMSLQNLITGVNDASETKSIKDSVVMLQFISKEDKYPFIKSIYNVLCSRGLDPVADSLVEYLNDLEDSNRRLEAKVDYLSKMIDAISSSAWHNSKDCEPQETGDYLCKVKSSVLDNDTSYSVCRWCNSPFVIGGHNWRSNGLIVTAWREIT